MDVSCGQRLNQQVEMGLARLCDIVYGCVRCWLQPLFCQPSFCHSCCLKGSFPSLSLTFAVYDLQPFSSFLGSVDRHGTCQCSVSLPDTTFPADRVERLEFTAHNLSQKFEREFSKVSVFFSNSTLICSKSLSPLHRG